MEEKELKALLDGVAKEHKAAIKSEIENAVNAAGLMKADDLAGKFEAMGLTDKTIKELTEAVEKQGEELRKIFEKGQDQAKSIDQVIDEKAAEIKKLATGEAKVVKLDIPRVQKADVLTTAVSGNTMAMRLPGVGQLAHLRPVLASLFRRVPLGAGSNGTIRYYDQANITRGADNKAENAAYAESAIDWIERSASVVKITDSIPVTEEAFNDIDFIKGELDTLLNINMTLKEDSQLYSGTGVAPQMKGINVYATSLQATLEAAPYADEYTEVNVYDLIAVLRTVLTTSKQSKYMPNIVLMNPVDILKFKLRKASDGHYVLPPFIGANGLVVDNVLVVESNQVTVDTLTIGDFRFGTIYEAQGLQIEMGRVNAQFTEGAMTLRATKREMLLVRNVDAEAFGKLTGIDRGIAYLDSGVANPA